MPDTQSTCAIKVGRLLEIRRSAGHRSEAELHAFFDSIAAEIARLPNRTKVVIVADWRACPLMSGEVADSLLANMTVNNPVIELSGVLASADSPIQVLQFQRLIRDTHCAQRKLFFNPEELKNWFRPALNQEEYQRLGKFLAEYKAT